MSVEEHFMLREIREDADAAKKTIEGFKDIEKVAEELLETKYDLYIVTGAGTSLHAGIAASYAFYELVGLPIMPIHAVEFIHTPSGMLEGRKTLVIAISQSGETSDTLRAVRKAKEQGADILGVTNFPESSLAKESKYKLITKAGEEKAVVATKTYVAQLTALYGLSVALAHKMGRDVGKLIDEIKNIGEPIRKALGTEDDVKKISRYAKPFVDAYVLGADVTFPTALEAALKLKEGCLIHSEAFSAPEFRHGPISLVDSSSLILALYPPVVRKNAHEAFHKVVAEVYEAGATVIAIAEEEDESPKECSDFIINVPKVSPVFASAVYVVPCQLLTYYIAIAKGLNPDKPRRLTKVIRV
ncbi:MAG: hypothetical protein DRJ66_04495 [Thermoprotei archaeon]|nr:MAG: hypothetical protein DRJ66_04495 [Thermoprotei archaeon]